MKIFRWLLCHLLSIILILSAVLVFYFRDEIRSDLNGQPVVEQTNEQLSGQMSGQMSGQQLIPATATARTGEQQPDIKEMTEISPTDGQQQGSLPAEPILQLDNVAPSADAKNLRPGNDPWGRSRPEPDPANDLPAGNSATEVPGPAAQPNFPPENYDPETDSGSIAVPNDRPVTDNAQPGNSATANRNIQTNENSAADDYFTALEQARRFYWDGNGERAQKVYEELMFQYKDRPEAAAELGNMLLQQGNRDGATWAYQNAIPRYLNLHQEQEAISIIELLSQYDPATAEKLQKKYW